MRSKPARQARAPTAPACFLTHATRTRKTERIKKKHKIMSRMGQESPGILKVFNFRDVVPYVFRTEV
jgi:hypothetical protein